MRNAKCIASAATANDGLLHSGIAASTLNSESESIAISEAESESTAISDSESESTAISASATSAGAASALVVPDVQGTCTETSAGAIALGWVW